MQNQPFGHEDIGPYRLLGSIGRGGMAEVFMAEHRHLGQVRAVKVVLPEIARHPGLVGRLLTEARATARLRHPAIVQVFDCDTLPQGGAFIAMEYLDGEPLSRWLERAGGLAAHPRLAAAIVGVAADGLGFAHERAVVHRDIKPENLFLVPEPADRRRFSLRILDFGVAKLLGEEPLITTRDGSVIGTPVYMAPEQCRSGGIVDRRADIYALGCVLFELLANRPPFSCVDGWEMMQAHIAEAPPSLASLVPSVPRALAQLVAGMLAKSPNDRPQTMGEVSGRLASFLGCGPADFGPLLLAPQHLAVASSLAEGARLGGAVTLMHLGPRSTPDRARGSFTPPSTPSSGPSDLGPARTELVSRRLALGPLARFKGRAAIVVGAVAALAGVVFLFGFVQRPAIPVRPSTAVPPAPVAPVPAAVLAPIPTTLAPATPPAGSTAVPRAAAGRAPRPPKPTTASAARGKLQRSANAYLPVAD